MSVCAHGWQQQQVPLVPAQAATVHAALPFLARALPGDLALSRNVRAGRDLSPSSPAAAGPAKSGRVLGHGLPSLQLSGFKASLTEFEDHIAEILLSF